MWHGDILAVSEERIFSVKRRFVEGVVETEARPLEESGRESGAE